MKVLTPIKGFVGVLIGATLGGEAIKQVGSTTAIPSGIRNVTQVGIAIGVAGTAIGGFFRVGKRK